MQDQDGQNINSAEIVTKHFRTSLIKHDLLSMPILDRISIKTHRTTVWRLKLQVCYAFSSLNKNWAKEIWQSSVAFKHRTFLDIATVS